MAIKSGRISAVEQGGRRYVDPKVADAEWARNTNPSQSSRAANRAGKTASASAEYWANRARREAAEAMIAELKAAELAKRLVSIERVRVSAMRMARMLRDAVLALPHRLSPALAVESDPRKIELILDDAIRSVLNDIASMSERDLERIADDR